MALSLTQEHRDTMADVRLLKFAKLIDPQDEYLADLVHAGYVAWNWLGGLAIYEITASGYDALARKD